MSSSESSTASPSPPASPAAFTYQGPPNLERLVLHFVAAKRALNSSQHVGRVTHLVASSRHLIEETTILSAKNAFATGKIYQQIETLHAIRNSITATGETVDDAFQSVITSLDAANDRLHTTLDALKNIIVDASLQSEAAEVRDTEVPHHRTLFDFVDESQYEQISASIRTLIDTFQASRNELDSSLEKFKSLITDVAGFLDESARSDSPTIKSTIYDEPLIPVSEAFSRMEEHAAEMATLLQSLISHYDLCVSALKHTEGGKEAAQKAVLASNADNAMDESLFGMKLVDPISDEERIQMMHVLEGDAEEVDDVVHDIRDRSTELEGLHAQLTRRANLAKTRCKSLRQAVNLLARIRQALPLYVDTATSFDMTWQNIQSSIEARMQDIVGFRAFYDEFHTGYKKLLREVERRKGIETRMRKLAVKTQRELDQLYNADKLARVEFVEEVASFLPSDLWPGVAELGTKWEFRAASPTTDSIQTTDSLPP